MGSDYAVQAALWGLLGGFIYAGPKLIAGLYSARVAGHRPWLCVWEFIVSMLASSGASAAMSPWVLAQGYGFLGKPGPHQMPALACLVGYYFNQLGPHLLDGIKKRILAGIASAGTDKV